METLYQVFIKLESFYMIYVSNHLYSLMQGYLYLLKYFLTQNHDILPLLPRMSRDVHKDRGHI